MGNLIISGWCFGTWILFSHILGIIIPIDELIFFRGVGCHHQPELNIIPRILDTRLWELPYSAMFWSNFLGRVADVAGRGTTLRADSLANRWVLSFLSSEVFWKTSRFALFDIFRLGGSFGHPKPCFSQPKPKGAPSLFPRMGIFTREECGLSVNSVCKFIQ